MTEPRDYEGYIDEMGDERQFWKPITPSEHRRAQQCSACDHVTCSRCGYVVPPNALEQFRSHVCARPWGLTDD